MRSLDQVIYNCNAWWIPPDAKKPHIGGNISLARIVVRHAPQVMGRSYLIVHFNGFTVHSRIPLYATCRISFVGTITTQLLCVNATKKDSENVRLGCLTLAIHLQRVLSRNSRNIRERYITTVGFDVLLAYQSLRNRI